MAWSSASPVPRTMPSKSTVSGSASWIFEFVVALHVQHPAKKSQQKDHLKQRVDRQRLPAPHAGLGQFLFRLFQPALAARRQTDEVERIVQKPPAAPSRSARNRTTAQGLQLIQTTLQRVFLIAKQLGPRPNDGRQGDRQQHEDKKRNEHQNFGFAILRITRMPMISETMAYVRNS